MNVRKSIDYSALFATLGELMSADLPLMELYRKIGKLISARPEKGAAVAAAEYLYAAYPDVSGFSPRNLRRMREFYRAYESVPEMLAQAMTIGWTQNTVILEAELTLQERVWYIRATRQFRWSKLELRRKIAAKIHLEIVLDSVDEICYTEEKNTSMECGADEKNPVRVPREYLPKPNGRVCNERPGEKSGDGGPISDCLRRYQHRGARLPRLSPYPPEAGRAWDQLCRENGPPAHKGRLCPIRPPDWDGPGQYPQFEPHLRRRSRREDQAVAGLHGPPRRCGGPLVYG